MNIFEMIAATAMLIVMVICFLIPFIIIGYVAWQNLTKKDDEATKLP